MSKREDLNIHEAHERAEHVHSDVALAPISFTMAILAVLAALVSSLGHRAHNEVLLSQTQVNFYKAELVRLGTQKHADEVLIELLAIVNTPQAGETREKVKREIQMFAHEEESTNAEESRLEEERAHYKKKSNRLDLGELFLETSLVLCSITLLTKQRPYWFAGIASGVIGVGLAIFAFLLV